MTFFWHEKSKFLILIISLYLRESNIILESSDECFFIENVEVIEFDSRLSSSFRVSIFRKEETL